MPSLHRIRLKEDDGLPQHSESADLATDLPFTTNYVFSDMNWQGLLEFLGGTTAISVTIGFLGKKAIEGYISDKIEAYKSELQRITTEHSVRFQRLHAERAEVIKHLYGEIVILDDLLTSTLRQFQSIEEPSLPEKVKHLIKQYNSLREDFLPTRSF
jgi:hypothetical protein